MNGQSQYKDGDYPMHERRNVEKGVVLFMTQGVCGSLRVS